MALTNNIFRESGVHYVTVWMEGRIEDDSPSVSAPDEIEEARWFPLDDLPEPVFLPFLNLLCGKCYSI
jgi:8-oxo-dGTP diphosphatase